MSQNSNSEIKFFTTNNLLLVVTLVSIPAIFINFVVFAQRTAPTAAPTITTELININNQNIASYPIAGTCTPNLGRVYISQVSRFYQNSLVPCRSSGTFSAKLNFQGIPDGNVTFSASQTDVAGNVSNLYTSPKIVKNTVASPAPGKPSLAPGSDNGVLTTDNITTVTNPTFIGTCNTGETVQLYINNRLVSARGVVPTSLCTKGSYSITYVTGLALNPSYYRASVAQVNASGNISSNSNALTFYEDGPTSPTPTTAPELATVSGYGKSNITSEVHPKIQGSCTIGDKISLYDQNHGNVQLFPTARCIGGRYNIVLDAALSQGLHKIYQKSSQLVTYCCYNKISDAGPTFDLTIVTPDNQTPNIKHNSDFSGDGKNDIILVNGAEPKSGAAFGQ